MVLTYGYVTPSTAAAAVVICSISYLTLLSIYRIFFHPLSKYPGPLLWKISSLPTEYHLFKGTMVYRTAELHDTYGPIIRLGPNSLTYILEDAWIDIYGRPPNRNSPLSKDDGQFVPLGDSAPGLLFEPDHNAHARIRRNLNPGFSEKAVREQEPIVMGYVDLLIQRLHENCHSPVDVVKWFNATTFDVVGDLTFGEPYGSLETSQVHFYIQTIFHALKTILFMALLRGYGLHRILFAMAPKSVKQKQKDHMAVNEEKLKKRIESGSSRPDFLSLAIKQFNQSNGMSMDELNSTVGTLIFAGSETTATLLCGCIYYLSTHSEVSRRLANEIRSSFRSESEIDMVSVNSLTYMIAVLTETLRIYPPAPASFNRVVPKEGCTIVGSYLPGNTVVAINQWSANHSPSNFTRPDEFLPQRWLGDPEFENDKKKAMQPFGVGPRSCIGKSLAYAEMRVILAKFLWNFNVQLADGMQGWIEKQKIYLVYVKPELFVKLTPVKS